MEFDSLINELDYQATEDIFLEEDVIEFDDYAIDFSYQVEYSQYTLLQLQFFYLTHCLTNYD